MRISLGIELTKIMVLQYSNQETSVTIGESVRDEDGMWCILCGQWMIDHTLKKEEGMIC